MNYKIYNNNEPVKFIDLDRPVERNYRFTNGVCSISLDDVINSVQFEINSDAISYFDMGAALHAIADKYYNYKQSHQHITPSDCVDYYKAIKFEVASKLAEKYKKK